jgi:NAD(P)-dependent dehydrogenase (short-subunit alcohol dehydrogenase family)
MNQLHDKVALIVGAGSGIGRAAADRMSELGAVVVLADITDAPNEAVEEFRSRGGTAMAARVDVTEEASVANMIASTVAEYGRLDIIHNNAAALTLDVLGRDGFIHEMDIDVWDQTMAVNLRGVMLGCKHAVPEMIKAGGGSIINTSSVDASRGDVVRAAYGASKAALETLTVYVACMYGPQNIRCNAVAPGLTVTDLTMSHPSAAIEELLRRQPLSAPMHPRDQANVIAFLASDDAKFITGQTIVVDGGFIGHMPQMGDYV